MATIVAPARRSDVIGVPRAARAAMVFGLATPVALGVAVALPLPVAVLGIATIGAVHVLFELRYVAGRFGDRVPMPLLMGLLGVTTVIAISRLLPTGDGPRRVEVVAATVLIGLVAVWARRRRPQIAAALGGGAVAVGAVSMAFPAAYLVVLSHLHNVVAAAFVWEWASGVTDRQLRRRLRGAQIAWAVVVPALILGGAFDRWIADSPAALAGVASTSFAPGSLASGPFAARLLTVFAFGQLMHYVTWCGVMPWLGRDEVTRVGRSPVGPVARGRPFALVAAVMSLVLGVAFAVDYRSGRSVYGSLASYHVYLELPILAALLSGVGAALPKDTR
jgi:MYXO-CTERM domain-containing protein